MFSPLFFQALLGSIVFGEILTLRWFMGASIIIVGVLLMNLGLKSDKGGESKKD